MDTLDGIKTVIAVVESGSFTAAAEKLAMSKGLVSKYIKEVEAGLNSRLFNRNTRQISLTDAGNNYYQHAIKLLENYNVMIDDVVSNQSSPSGLLRVSSPIAFGEHIMATLIPEFCRHYPAITVDLTLNNHAVSMLEEGIDIRIKSGQVEDSNMIARPLCMWPLIICSSPHYLQQFGIPTKPEELSEYQCVLDSNLKDAQYWTFISGNEVQQTVQVHSNISSNNPQAVVNIVKSGGGIGLMAKGSVKTEIDNGELVELFTDYKALELDIFLIYPHRKHIPKKVQCFIDFMLSHFS